MVTEQHGQTGKPSSSGSDGERDTLRREIQARTLQEAADLTEQHYRGQVNMDWLRVRAQRLA